MSRSCKSLLCASLIASPGCAEPTTILTPSPILDASLDTTPADTSVATDAPVDRADTAADSPDVEDLPDVAILDACTIDSPEEENGPCAQGERQRRWCGRCGREHRVCGPEGEWGAWGLCIEDPDAECSPCESSSAPCGRCGAQPVWCDTSGDRCRWVRGPCGGEGSCLAGAFESQAGLCSDGLAEVRYCTKTCEWGPWSPCKLKPQWGTMADAPIQPRRDFAAVGDLLVWGGAMDGAVFDDGAVYDPVTDTWAPIPPVDLTGLPDPARRNMAAAGDRSFLFLFGGLDASGNVLGDGAIWSEAEGWRLLPTEGAPSPRFDGKAIVLPEDGSIFVYGGRSGFGNAASGGALYHPNLVEWVPIPPAPMGNRQEHSILWDPVDKRLILWGGRAGDGEAPSATGARFDPETQTWDTMAEAPVRRAGHFAFWDPDANRMLVVFGKDDQWPGHRNDGVAYHPATDTWTWLPDVAITGLVPSDGMAVIRGIRELWALGGGGLDGTGTRRGARLDWESNVWAPVPELPEASPFLRGSLSEGSEPFPYVWGIGGGERFDGYRK